MNSASILLAEGIGVEVTGGAGEFGFGDDATLFGGVVTGFPFGIVLLATLVAIIKVIAAAGGTEEESAALTIGEGGAEDIAPSFRFHGSILVQHEEIDAIAAEGVWIMGPCDDDG